jgi:hypothetical protein
MSPTAACGWDCFDDLHQGIGDAGSWSELEGWVTQASRAHAMGLLDAAELDTLTELAIGLSHGITRQPEPGRPRRRHRHPVLARR